MAQIDIPSVDDVDGFSAEFMASGFTTKQIAESRNDVQLRLEWSLGSECFWYFLDR